MENEVKLAIIETKLGKIEHDVQEIKSDIKDLVTFKLKVLGAGMFGGFLMTVLSKIIPLL